MSDAALKAAHELREAMRFMEFDDVDEQIISKLIDQAADEKYRPLVEAVERDISAYGDNEDLRDALRKVKEG